MQIKNYRIELQTKELFEITDITEKVEGFIKESQIKNGIVNIQSLHTTATVLVQENEPLLLQDIKNYLERMVPQSVKYNHDDLTRRTVNVCPDECINGHSHCKALNLPTSVTLNIIDGKIVFGQWQRILFIELDRSRPRKVSLQIIGE